MTVYWSDAKSLLAVIQRVNFHIGHRPPARFGADKISFPSRAKQHREQEQAVTEHQLSQKVAVVTGGGSGIGAGIARKLASLGAAVIICGRNRSHLEETASQIRFAGGQSEALTCD